MSLNDVEDRIDVSLAATESDKWAHTILMNLNDRNKRQVDPFIAIFQSNSKLWYEHARLQSLLKDVKHQFAIVQHEAAELLTTSSSDSATAVDKLKLKLAQIQIELREKGNLESNERKQKVDLTKKVRDQKKLLADQSEELKMAKSELSSAHEMMAYLREDVRIEKNAALAVKDELENVRKLFRKMEEENIQLIDRIILEKSKTAQAMNDMVNGKEGKEGGITNKTIAAVDPVPGTVSSSRQSNFRSGSLSGQDSITIKMISMAAVNVLQCHSSEINDVCVTSTGQHFVTAGSDSTVKVFQLSSGRCLRDLKSSSPVICVDVSRSGSQGGQGSQGSSDSSSGGDQYVAAGSADGSCRVWSLQTGVLRLQFTGHASKVQSCNILGDGSSRMVTGSADRSIKLWDISGKGDAVAVMKASSSVFSVTVAPDSNTIVSGHQDGSVRFWDPQRSTLAHSVDKLHNAHVTHVEYSPQNCYEIMTASKDNTLSILDTRTYKAAQVLTAPSLRITYDWSRTSFSPDGRYAAAGSADGNILLWDLSTSKLLLTLLAKSDGHSSAATAVSWLARTGELVSADKQGKCVIWR